MVTITQKGGDFKKTEAFLEKLLHNVNPAIVEKYGQKGVEALSRATPVDSGKTASSWSYSIEQSGNRVTLKFFNSNIQDHVNIAIILQYGHVTGTGGYVRGIDYINPALRPVFEELANEAWKELVDI